MFNLCAVAASVFVDFLVAYSSSSSSAIRRPTQNVYNCCCGSSIFGGFKIVKPRLRTCCMRGYPYIVRITSNFVVLSAWKLVSTVVSLLNTILDLVWFCDIFCMSPIGANIRSQRQQQPRRRANPKEETETNEKTKNGSNTKNHEHYYLGKWKQYQVQTPRNRILPAVSLPQTK